MGQARLYGIPSVDAGPFYDIVFTFQVDAEEKVIAAAAEEESDVMQLDSVCMQHGPIGS
jgi:hypothetical protein